MNVTIPGEYQRLLAIKGEPMSIQINRLYQLLIIRVSLVRAQVEEPNF